MAYLTIDELRNLKITNEDISKAKAEAGYRNIIFLSHSSKDNEILGSVVKFLMDYDVKVYIDNGDKRLPTVPSPETAFILRDEIRNSDRLIVLISENSATSGWIPWELGMADGHKGYKNIALLPISNSSVEEEWARREYLGLYPVIRKSYITDQPGLHWIVDPPTNDIAKHLSDWLTWKN